MFARTHFNVARDIGSRCSARHVIHVSCACVFDFSSTLHFALFTVSLIIYFISPNLHLHLLCGSVRREIPCALPRMRGLTLWSTTPLSQVMSPISSTTTTSQRPLKFSSRSPATPGPRTCMTWRSVTPPSAERSLHHCSLRSEKIQRAVDKLITLLKKVCCHVRRCLSVMQERGDLLMSWDHSNQTPEEIHVTTQKMSKSGFFWNDKETRFSLSVEQRFRKREFQTDYDRRSYPKIEWSYRVSTR